MGSDQDDDEEEEDFEQCTHDEQHKDKGNDMLDISPLENTYYNA
jgi:hypothetical protein